MGYGRGGARRPRSTVRPLARFFAEAKGDVNLAKASYLSHKFDELKEQQSKADAERRSADAAALVEAAAERLSREAKTLAYFPAWAKGTCPNCGVLLMSSATQCQTCGTSFEGETACKPKPFTG